MNPIGIVRALWDGFAVLGLLHTLGESAPEPCPDRGPAVGGPPLGHPERLCPEVPLSPLERRLRRELRRTPRAGG